jgi:hypothetical protein
MLYARIDLSKTNYAPMVDRWRYLRQPNVAQLGDLYLRYCKHKRFPSFMPIFASEYTDQSNDVIGYYDKHDELVAFSLIRRYDIYDAECIQFAWDYADPKLRLGIASLRHECAIYKDRGFRYLYLGEADEYKAEIDGFEVMGPA